MIPQKIHGMAMTTITTDAVAQIIKTATENLYTDV